MPTLRTFVAAVWVVAVSTAAAFSSLPAAAQEIQLPSGYTAEPFASNLIAPTHAVFDDQGHLYVTQLNGGENDGKGQVLRFDESGADPEVVLEGLFKPTGIAWTPDGLYLVAGNSVYIARAEGDNKYAAPEALFSDLPFNGRSNGQIYIGFDGRLYFQSSGTENAPDASGVIYVSNTDGTSRAIFATGFKNAYAMTWDSDGLLFATEIGDRYLLGYGQPVEEVNRVEASGFYGWPYCYLDYQDPNRRDQCATARPPLATLPPQSTPTGIAYYEDRLIVAIWGVDPRLLSVDPASGDVTEFARGFKRPVAVLVTPTGQLLVLDIDGGTITQIVHNKTPATPQATVQVTQSATP